MYCRLSKDDGSTNESMSIYSQKAMLKQYAEQNNIAVYDYYVDDGYSGTNFERPAFKKMITDIENGKINCVITKDLSRLGREYLEMGRLIDKVFPFLGVRFISVNDKLDTVKETDSKKSFEVTLKNIINDMYAKDISVKIKTSKHNRARNGYFIGSVPPYGYKIKKTKEGHRFIIEKHTAETNIYYALDLGKSYRLIDESMLESLGLTEQQVKEMSLFNIRKLKNEYKTDEVKGNIFYFVNSNDGYDASRILNTKFLDDIYQQCEGEMLVAVPHQDVLVIADIRNKTGYDVMAHLTMEFFTKGLVPITSLSFGYEKGHFEPIFILGKNNKQKRDPNVIQRLEANRKRFNNKK
ncbi:MAG: DUF1444 family protein [Staphylococcus sp.]|nr:DUF1444 family protein [Staphylococcus sp.]